MYRPDLLLDRYHQPKELYNLADDPLEFFNPITDQEDTTRHLQAIFDGYIASIESDPLRQKH